MRVYGGFLGNETSRDQRDWQRNVTTLSGILAAGGQSYHVVDTSNTADGRLDGFVIEAGMAVGSGNDASGAGIYSVGGYATLANLIIRNCLAQNLGGGLYSKDGALKLKTIVFQQCSAGSGGAMYTEKGNPEISDSLFVENTANLRGGAIYFYDWASTNNPRNPRLISVKFDRNRARDGAAIYSNQSFLKIDRGTFTSNEATNSGGGIFVYLTYWYLAKAYA